MKSATDTNTLRVSSIPYNHNANSHHPSSPILSPLHMDHTIEKPDIPLEIFPLGHPVGNYYTSLSDENYSLFSQLDNTALTHEQSSSKVINSDASQNTKSYYKTSSTFSPFNNSRLSFDTIDSNSLNLSNTNTLSPFGDTPSVPVKLFVNRIPKWICSENLKLIFSSYGRVLECNILKDQDGHKGCAFIKFASIKDAHLAILHLHSKVILNEEAGPIQIKYADGELDRLGLSPDCQPGGEAVKVFVGCLSKTTTEDELFSLFSRFGRVDEVFVIRDNNKQPKCSAFVTFPRKSMALAAIRALNKNYYLPPGRRAIEVRLAEGKGAKNKLSRISDDSHLQKQKSFVTSKGTPNLFGLSAIMNMPNKQLNYNENTYPTDDKHDSYYKNNILPPFNSNSDEGLPNTPQIQNRPICNGSLNGNFSGSHFMNPYGDGLFLKSSHFVNSTPHYLSFPSATPPPIPQHLAQQQTNPSTSPNYLSSNNFVMSQNPISPNCIEYASPDWNTFYFNLSRQISQCESSKLHTHYNHDRLYMGNDILRTVQSDFALPSMPYSTEIMSKRMFLGGDNQRNGYEVSLQNDIYPSYPI